MYNNAYSPPNPYILHHSEKSWQPIDFENSQLSRAHAHTHIDPRKLLRFKVESRRRDIAWRAAASCHTVASRKNTRALALELITLSCRIEFLESASSAQFRGRINRFLILRSERCQRSDSVKSVHAHTFFIVTVLYCHL